MLEKSHKSNQALLVFFSVWEVWVAVPILVLLSNSNSISNFCINCGFSLVQVSIGPH